MTPQVLSPDGSMDNPDNHPINHLRILQSRRASLIQQAKALAEARRALLGEVGEIEKELGGITTAVNAVTIGDTDSIS